MKSIVCAILVGCALLNAHAAPKTITVDNKPGSVAMFTTVNAAVAAAEPGDTILVAGSPDTYPGVTISKRVNIVGPGYLLAENNIPGITKDRATFHILFQNVELSSPSGSTVTGVTGDIHVPAGVRDILIDKCWMTPYIGGHVTIKRSYLPNGVGFNGAAPDCSIENSFIIGYLHLNTTATAQNCVMSLPHGQVTGPAGASISGFIFVLHNTGFANGSYLAEYRGSMTHSMEVGPLGAGDRPSNLPPGAGNLDRIYFLSQVFNIAAAHEHYYKQAPNSPAIGTGLNGGDMGMFTGVQPYVISGVPSIPRITRFLVPSTATDTTGLRIELDAEAF